MATYQLEITQPRPYFAELPYYIWGQVNYDSEGDCKCPTDRQWHWIELTHRETDEHLTVSGESHVWTVAGPDPTAARLAHFLAVRCGGRLLGTSPPDALGDWDHQQALQRAARVERDFKRSELEPFDKGHLFWGSWKWIGWFATEFTWVGRWIMDSVLRNDTRAVNLCADWLKEGTYSEAQSEALRYALNRLTGLALDSDNEWIDWYFHGPGNDEFPEPDFAAWYADMKRIHGDT